MAKNVFYFSRPSISLKTALLAGVFAGTSVLGACSQVPDAVNPVEWYKSTTDFFTGDKADPKKSAGKESGLSADRGKAPPGSDKSFPNLASVDRQAQSRDKKGGGLVADSDRPKYAPAIARQGASSETLAQKSPPKAPSVAATMPPPSAVPTAPVSQVPMKAPSAQPPAMTAQASPTLVTPNLTVDQQETEQRLARQLADLRARAQAPDTLSKQPFAAPSGEFETIVISSDGIQAAGSLETQDPVAVAPVSPPTSRGASQLIERQVASRATGSGQKVATILFDNGSSSLKAHDKRILSAVTRLQKKSGGIIRIVGHASSRTRSLSAIKHKMVNFKISIDRADRVVGELVRLGIKNENIEIAAVADTEPLYYEFMPTGEAGNRRTEVYLVN
ncbi:MAG: OmpA family protein [Rhodospirillales bacterium]|nr:OmpA family protein [Rhodospirillales bacterium]